MRDLAQRFMELFDGLEKAYGTYQINSERASDGKKVGKAVTNKKPVTVDLWENHLNGTLGIGVIPIKDNSRCRFGAIDIDVYAGLNLLEILKKVQKHKFPLVVCRSKSGGCHLFIFTKEEVTAELLVNKLKDMAATLGFGNCEIYPRQTQILVERGDIGQWINVPYFNGVKGLRYGITADNKPLSPQEFLAYAEKMKVNENELAKIGSEKREDLADGPPCLQHLVSQGFPEGTRNDGLFNIGVYVQKAYPDDWEAKLEEYNVKYMDPPLKSIEVQGVLKSLKKKDYGYTCDKAPIISYCNNLVCRSRRFGIGGNFAIPSLSGLTKYNSDPPIWFINVEGAGRLELMTEDLQNQIRFQKRCIECLNMMPPVINKNQWQQLVHKLLEGVIIIEAPVDASPTGQLLEHLERFCTQRAQAQLKEEMLLGKPWSGNKRTHFRMSDFVAYLERIHFREFKVNKITSIIKDKLKAEHHFDLLKGKGTNYWSVPEFMKQTESHKIPEFQKEVPF